MKKLFFGIAVAGLGTFAMAQQTMPPMREGAAHEKLTPEQRDQKMREMEGRRMDKMKQDLNLTPAQVQQIQAMHDKRRAEMTANKANVAEARRENLEKFKAMRTQEDAQMRQILSPDQYQKWVSGRKAVVDRRPGDLRNPKAELRVKGAQK